MAFTNPQKKWIFIILFVVLLTLSLWIIKGYLSAIFVGALVTYFVYPLYDKFQKRIPKRLSQILVTGGAVLVVIIMLTALIVPLATQTRALYDQSEDFIIQYTSEEGACEDPTSSSCTIYLQAQTFLQDKDLQQKGKEVIQKTSSFFFKSIKSFISSALSIAIFFVILIFSLFYFLEHGMEIKRTIMELLPLEKAHKQKIYDRLKETLDAVVGGNIATALLQGILGAMMFWILGLPSPLFWGLLMAILAFIPAVGPLVIWLPTAIILLVQGNVWQGIVLTVFGVVVLGYIDNFLKPKLIGDKIKLSAFAIFLGVLGGISTFGILGLFIGPIILALLVSFVQMYRELG